MEVCSRINNKGVVEYFIPNEYGLMVRTPIITSEQNILNCQADKNHFVYTTSRPYVWYNDQYYYKIVNPREREAFRRLGNHPNFPIIYQEWPIPEGKLLIVMDHKHGQSPEYARVDLLTIDEQYRYHTLVYQTLSAIDFAHSMGIELFDVASWENVIIDLGRSMMYFIDLGDTIYDEPITRNYDTIAIIWHLIYIWVGFDLDDFMREKIKGPTQDEDDDYYNDDIFAVDHPDLMLQFLQRRISRYRPDSPAYRALYLMINRLQQTLSSGASTSFIESFVGRHQ